MKLIALVLLCLALATKLPAQEKEDTCTFLTTINNPSAMLYEKPKIAPNNEIRLMNINEPVFVIGKTGKFAIVLEGFDAKYLLLENTQLSRAQIDSLTPTNISEKILQIDNSFTPLNMSVAKQKDSLIKLGKMLYGLSKFTVAADTFFMQKGIKTKGCTISIKVTGQDQVKTVYAEIEGMNSINDAEATKTVTCQFSDGKKAGIFTFADLFNDKGNVIDHLTIKKITVELANNSKKEYSGDNLNKIIYPSPTVSLPAADKPEN